MRRSGWKITGEAITMQNMLWLGGNRLRLCL